MRRRSTGSPRRTSTSSVRRKCRWRASIWTKSSTCPTARSGLPAGSPATGGGGGSYGKDTRGIIRVHQFDKVEMFSYCSLEDAAAEHQRLLGWEKEMLDEMELAYRVIDTAAG